MSENMIPKLSVVKIQDYLTTPLLSTYKVLFLFCFSLWSFGIVTLSLVPSDFSRLPWFVISNQRSIFTRIYFSIYEGLGNSFFHSFYSLGRPSWDVPSTRVLLVSGTTGTLCYRTIHENRWTTPRFTIKNFFSTTFSCIVSSFSFSLPNWKFPSFNDDVSNSFLQKYEK